MAERKAISKKLRFEVFKRDSFTCQYCGKSAPDVVLHVDHIAPVKRGGKNDILNLITSCIDCNLGKGARELSDNSVLAKQQAQLQDLNERREQMELMLKWRKGLDDLSEMQLAEVEKYFKQLTGNVFSDYGRREAKKWIKKFGLHELLEGMETSASQYLAVGKGGGFTPESINKVFDYTPKICQVNKSSKEKPYLRDLIKLRWLAKKELWNSKEWEIMRVLESAHLAGVSIDDLREFINECGTWAQFKNTLGDVTGAYYG